MDNVRCLRKRKSTENDLDKQVNKQCKTHQKKDGRQRQTAVNKNIKQKKSAADFRNAKPLGHDAREKQVPSKTIQTERGLRKDIEAKKVYIKGSKSTNGRPGLKRPTVQAKGKETKEKSDIISISHPCIKVQTDNTTLQAGNALNSGLESSIGSTNLLSQKNTNLEGEISHVKKVNEEKDRQIVSLELRLRDAINDNEEIKNKLIQKEQIRESKITKLMNEIEELKQNNNSLQIKLMDMKRKLQESNTYEAKVLDLKQELEKIKERYFEKDETLKALQQDHKELQRMYDNIKEEVGQFKRIKTIKVQLFHCSKVPLVSKVENEMTALLKKEMEDDVTKLEFIECEKDTNIVPGTPLLIVCICASRLGTDAQNVIKTLNVTSRMALLVFHHKDEHALPHQASEHVLTGQEFKCLGGIFDFGFLSSKGIYSCQLNDQNLKYVVNFINKESTRLVKEVAKTSDS